MFSRLMPLLLPACMVDTPVVEGPADPLGEDLAAWCASTCDMWMGCGIDVEENCSGSCVSYFSETFVGNGEICTNAGLRLMDCMESLTCPEVLGDDPCNVRAEERRCDGSGVGIVCDAEDQGANSSGFSCDFGFSDCSDGREYRLLCEGPENPPECQCLVDGESTGRFQLSELVCPTRVEAKQICGWPILEQGHRPTPAVHCDVSGSSGVAGGAGVNECGISFGACSDGSEYGIECSGPPGAVVCTCEVDGASFGSFSSGAGICDYYDSPDSGAAMANYTCGYSLAPIRFE